MDLADRAAAGHLATWPAMVDTLPGAWYEQADGLLAMVTRIPAPPFNGLWVYGDHDPAVAAELLARVADAGFPYCVQSRPGQIPALRRLVRAHHLQRLGDSPMMAITTPPPPPELPPDLSIHTLDPADSAIHLELVAIGFETPADLLEPLCSPAILALAGMRTFLVETHGEAAGTGVAFTREGATGLFSIVTLPAYRGRGYGTALTAVAARAGFDQGAEVVWLQSSPMGFPVYERMGFQVLEEWASWYS